MNSALVLANVIALAVLVGFHFLPEDNEKVAGRMPHYLQVQKTPQWAVLSDQRSALQAVSESEQVLPAQSTERLVF